MSKSRSVQRASSAWVKGRWVNTGPKRADSVIFVIAVVCCHSAIMFFLSPHLTMASFLVFFSSFLLKGSPTLCQGELLAVHFYVCSDCGQHLEWFKAVSLKKSCTVASFQNQTLGGCSTFEIKKKKKWTSAFQTHRPVCVVKEYVWFSEALESDILLSFSFVSAVVLHRQVWFLHASLNSGCVTASAEEKPTRSKCAALKRVQKREQTVVVLFYFPPHDVYDSFNITEVPFIVEWLIALQQV